MKLVKIDKEGYWHHSRAISKCVYHVVFCPKYRRPVLNPKIQARFRRLVKSRQKDWNFHVIEMEVMPDHVHLLLQCDPNIGVNNLAAKIKGYTASVLRREFPSLKSRLPSLWTRSRFIASVGTVQLDVVKQYIQDQKNV